MIRNILFDIGGVLVDLEVKRTLSAMKHFIDPQLAKQNNMVTADGLLGGHDSPLIDLYQTGEISTEDFMRQVLSVCMPGTNSDAIKAAWYAMLLGSSREVQILWQRLQEKGYTLYILSNINDLHAEWVLENCPFMDEAKQRFFSNEMHLAKPDPRCYQYVIEHAGILPEETLYVDDLLPNIEAGKAAGFQTIHAVGRGWRQQLRDLPNMNPNNYPLTCLGH